MFRNEVTQLDAITAILCIESSMTTSAIVDSVGNALHSNFTDNPDQEYAIQEQQIIAKLKSFDEFPDITQVHSGQSIRVQVNSGTVHVGFTFQVGRRRQHHRSSLSPPTLPTTTTTKRRLLYQPYPSLSQTTNPTHHHQPPYLNDTHHCHLAMPSPPRSLPNQQRVHFRPNPLSPSPPYPTTITVGGWWVGLVVCGDGCWWWVGFVVKVVLEWSWREELLVATIVVMVAVDLKCKI
uniref:Probable DNA helicase MCM9 n=1 Tax=Tanacetum cinerariifolium TaxID=118510 RepID=A0A699L7M1_TANCI|nr:probable DNA helicase MCM9 [Tanacetum cinerariifolium]